jgi:hypothetical protein
VRNIIVAILFSIGGSMHSTANSEGFFQALRADGPAAGQASKMTLYDRVFGDWSVEVIDHLPDGSRRLSSGEVHFAWVLEGRAIQDVWIVPARDQRNPGLPKPGNRYGTTLRIYDPAEDVWRVTWFNPLTGVSNHLVARQRGEDIVQEGTDGDGSRIRWSFTEITPSSFHWRGEISRDGGQTWLLQAEFFGRRRVVEARP